MWGNRLGWIISAGIAAVFGFALVYVALPASMEPPTGQLSVGLQVATLPVDPLSIFKPGTSDQDAGDLYREAMHDYDVNTQQYKDWEDNPNSALAADPAGVEKIVAARDCAKMNLFAKEPSELINYENDHPSLTAIHTVGTLMDQMALLAGASNDTAKAKKYGEALFALGYNLARERVRFEEWNEGVQLMRSAALDLVKGDPDKASAYSDFSENASKFMSDKISPFWQKLDGIDPQGYAGDIFQMAKPTNPEVMWRVEAVLRLGRLTYFVPTRDNPLVARGDQLVTRHFLTKLADDPNEDRLVHTAAAAAVTLMQHPEQYHRIGLSSQ
jgi:hypothetical protein